jgi:Uma2 family endonuclease
LRQELRYNVRSNAFRTEEIAVSKLKPGQLTVADYERAAREYCRSLPLEHFMAATPQATQRKITLESLDLLQVRCPRMQVFSELLIQYLHDGELKRVVPDNMVVLSDEPMRDRSSFNLEFEPDPPFWVLEWVSSSSEGKDYNDSFRKYESELIIPYCLMFHPDNLDLRMYRHTGKHYEPMAKNAHGRYAIDTLDLELGLLDRWVRFWHRQELLDLPPDLERRFKAEQQRAEQEKRRANREKKRADQEEQRAEKEKKRAEEERQNRLAAEAEVERLRTLLKLPPGTSGAPGTPGT